MPEPADRMKTEQHIWNEGSALERFGGDKDFLREMCQIFLEDSPKLLRRLRDGVQRGDPEEVMCAAHSLSGELVYLEASPALRAAKQLEGMGSQRDLNSAAEVFTRLEKEIENLHLCLKNFTRDSS